MNQRFAARSRVDTFGARARWIIAAQAIAFVAIVGRLWYLQVDQTSADVARRLGTRVTLPPGTQVRGSIFVRDGSLTPDRTLDGGQLFPVATNAKKYKLIQQGRVTMDPREWKRLAELSGLETDALNGQRAASGFYTVLKKDLEEEEAEALESLLPANMWLEPELVRAYPDPNFGGHVLGFFGYGSDGKPAGQYGLEGFYDESLRPKPGSQKELDGVVGQDLVLTIDRAVQYQACRAVADGVKEYKAESGTVIVVKPATGEIVAMCGAPDFYPEEYRSGDVAAFRNNAVSQAYEPGSTFKAITMAAGLDTEKVQPDSTYVDTGAEKIDRFTIRNSDKKANGRQTMTEVLEKSLNTGAIYVMRAVGKELFKNYALAFGFGEPTGVDLAAEAKGDVRALSRALDRNGEIFAATSSFGQGITASPLQVIMAYAAFANKGIMMRPYVVAERRAPDGQTWKTEPTVRRQVISERSASLLTGMLVAVVKFGHDKKAEIPGYTFAAKTGTSQVPDGKGGYAKGKTVQTFVGYGPVADPKFVMLVKFDSPQRNFAEGSALPTWKRMAEWLIAYWHLPPESQ